MSNPINIDDSCNQAIRREIGEQLRVYLRVSPRLPARLRKQVDRLYKLEGQSPPKCSRSGTRVQKQSFDRSEVFLTSARFPCGIRSPVPLSACRSDVRERFASITPGDSLAVSLLGLPIRTRAFALAREHQPPMRVVVSAQVSASERKPAPVADRLQHIQQIACVPLRN